MKKIMRSLVAACGLALVVSACGSSGGDTTTTVAADTSEATTAAVPEAKTAAQVADGLRAAGLPIGQITVFDATTDPNKQLGRPGQYTSKASFADTRIGTVVDGVEGGGDIEAFDDQAALTRRADYLKAFADQPPLGGWYQYTAGNVILRVPFALTPDQAQAYDDALQAQFR